MSHDFDDRPALRSAAPWGWALGALLVAGCEPPPSTRPPAPPRAAQPVPVVKLPAARPESDWAAEEAIVAREKEEYEQACQRVREEVERRRKETEPRLVLSAEVGPAGDREREEQMAAYPLQLRLHRDRALLEIAQREEDLARARLERALQRQRKLEGRCALNAAAASARTSARSR